MGQIYPAQRMLHAAEVALGRVGQQAPAARDRRAAGYPPCPAQRARPAPGQRLADRVIVYPELGSRVLATAAQAVEHEGPADIPQ